MNDTAREALGREPVAFMKEAKPIVRFSNRAGQSDSDDAIAAELEAAGIEVHRLELLRDTASEVKTAVRGGLHGWGFTRAWSYWVATGPGIELAAAERLYAAHPETVRVDGHCACPSPREWFKGLAVGSYHVDSPAGLKGLADTIKSLVERLAAPVPSETQGLQEAELSSDDLRLIDQAWENHKAALPVATVINNNQPGRTAIIEITIDPPTLDVGAKLYAEPKAITIATPSPAPGLVEAAEWQPIKTAPKGIKVLGGFYNALGNWRTVTARYYETETLESEDEETGFAPAGWYEESETHETILPIKLEFWLPLPLRARASGGSDAAR